MPIPTYRVAPTEARLRLQYLPTNQRFAFTFGDTLIRLHVADGTFYERKESAVADARLCGLTVNDIGDVGLADRAHAST